MEMKGSDEFAGSGATWGDLTLPPRGRHAGADGKQGQGRSDPPVFPFPHPFAAVPDHGVSGAASEHPAHVLTKHQRPALPSSISSSHVHCGLSH